MVGRRRFTAKIAPLKEEDTSAYAIRMDETMQDNIYCEVDDEVLLQTKE